MSWTHFKASIQYLDMWTAVCCSFPPPVNSWWLGFLSSESRHKSRDGMQHSKLGHVVNLCITLTSARNLLWIGRVGLVEGSLEVRHITEINHVNEDTRHGCVQATERGGFLWDWGSAREVSAVHSRLSGGCFRKWSLSLRVCGSGRVIHLSPACLTTRPSLCVCRHAFSWLV